MVAVAPNAVAMARNSRRLTSVPFLALGIASVTRGGIGSPFRFFYVFIYPFLLTVFVMDGGGFGESHAFFYDLLILFVLGGIRD